MSHRSELHADKEETRATKSQKSLFSETISHITQFLGGKLVIGNKLFLSLLIVAISFALLQCNMDLIGKIKERFSCCFNKTYCRVIKLLVSLWMIADIILDGFTTKGYLDYTLV